MKRDMADAVATAQAFVNQQFPDSLVAFVVGSAVHGRATAASDLDVVVLLPGDGPAYKEVFEAFGWPIEAFVITQRSYKELFASQPQIRVPALPMMCAEGVVLKDHGGFAQAIKREARAVLEQGPQPLTAREVDNYRFAITGYADDLAGADSLEECFFIAPALVDKLIDFTLAYHRRWGGEGKSRLRALGQFDPALADRVTSALKVLYQSEARQPTLDLAQDTLQPVGGRLHHGFATGKP